MRPDIIRNSACSHATLSGEIRVSQVKGDGLYEPLVVKEYIDFLSRCAPCPPSGIKVREIVPDVAEDHFKNQYTAEHAAELIDNRVQLYLDEQN